MQTITRKSKTKEETQQQLFYIRKRKRERETEKAYILCKNGKTKTKNGIGIICVSPVSDDVQYTFTHSHILYIWHTIIGGGVRTHIFINRKINKAKTFSTLSLVFFSRFLSFSPPFSILFGFVFYLHALFKYFKSKLPC